MLMTSRCRSRPLLQPGEFVDPSRARNHSEGTEVNEQLIWPACVQAYLDFAGG